MFCRRRFEPYPSPIVAESRKIGHPLGPHRNLRSKKIRPKGLLPGSENSLHGPDLESRLEMRKSLPTRYT